MNNVSGYDFFLVSLLLSRYTVTQRSPKSEEERYRLFWLCKGVSIGTVTVLTSFQHYSPAHIDLQCTVYSDKYSDVKASVHLEP